MKKFVYILLFALFVAGAASCKKENPSSGQSKYGADGVTPMPEAVDMGTVVNGKTVKWAAFNLGASSPEEYGSFYCWGELDTKTDYSKDTYTYYDTPAELPLSADVAHKKLGGHWRMPTWAEFEALLANCDVQEINGTVKGILFISKKNFRTIFLPLAGSMSGTEWRSIGGVTEYYSSTDFEGHDHLVRALLIYPKSAGFSYLTIMGNAAQYGGHVIRPVYVE